MFSAILLACSLEMNVCTTIAYPGIFKTQESCLEYLAKGYQAAEETGWTVINYQCLSWLDPSKSI